MSMIENFFTKTLGLSTGDIILGALEPVKESMYNETVKGLSRLLKIWIAVNMNFRNLLASFQQGMAFPEPHPAYGVSPSGIVDAIVSTLYATAITSGLLGEEVGEELWMEMIQEGVSNAFQTSLGGSLQTYMNVYRGGLPPSIDDITDMPQYWDMVDDKLLGFLLSSAGGNLYTTIHYGLRGIMNQLNQQYMNVTNQIQVLATRLIEDYLWHKNLYVEMKRDVLVSYIRSAIMFTEYIMTYVNDIIETAISRVNDYINELDTNKLAFDRGDINEEMFNGIMDSIEEAFYRLRDEVYDIIDAYSRIIDEAESIIPQEAIDDYKSALQELSNEYARIIEAVNNDYSNAMGYHLNRLMKGLEYLWAYRSYNIYREQLPEDYTLPLRITTKPVYKLGVTVGEKQ